MKSMTTRGMVLTDWDSDSWPALPDGKWTSSAIDRACVRHTASEISRCADLLQQILSRLDSLGADGIHRVIREAAKNAEAQRLQRIRRERAKRVKKVA